MSTDTLIALIVIGSSSTLLLAALIWGDVEDHRIDEQNEAEPDIATQVAWEDGYARPPAPVPFRAPVKVPVQRDRRAA